jgi:hypothetical protein
MMPNDSLLEELERLRDSYSQRQKATNSLLTALKGTTSTLGKATRNLNDYAIQQNNLNPALLAQSRQIFGTLRLKDEAIDPLLPELRREAKSLTRLTAALKDALVALRGENVDVIKLGHAHAALSAVKTPDPALAALLPALDQELQQAQYALGDTFGLALRNALAAQGISMFGRPPRFEIGRFEVVANFVTRSASISYGKDLITRRVPLSVEAVIKVYQRDAKAVLGRNEDGDRWIAQFYSAWENARRRRGATEKRANIVDCYFELMLLRQPKTFRSAPSKGSLVDYSRPQFAYDFFEFTNQQRRAYNGMYVAAHGATKSQADNPEKSFWIVEGDTPHAGRYIADVEFK